MTIDIDSKSRRGFICGKEVKLTATEFNLLQELVKNKGNVLTYEQIAASVWKHDAGRESVYAYIERLRLKIEPDPHNPRHIITLPRVGYRFDGD